MDWQCLLLVALCQILLKYASCKDITIQVNPRRLIQYVPERFLSMTLDPGTILLAGKLENEALNMARSLSPSFVRLGGTSTNYIKFGKDLMTDNTTIAEEQWDSVNEFARAAGMDLIVSLNPTERINGVWDSRDALKLISYSEKQGYSVAWQLGYDTKGISASGAEVGRDVIRLRKILDGFTKFTRSPVFAPDFPEIVNPLEAQFIRDLLIQAGPVLGAVFVQPPFKPEEDPAQTIMNTIVNLDRNVWSKALRLGRIIPRKPIWIAEKEISKGTSEDAISLARRLGVSARIGIQIVMRQVGPQSLMHPTPEFWMAVMYKNLVGRGVLDVRINPGQNQTNLHIFSHCAQSLPEDRSIIDAGMTYDKSAVTVYGVNEGTESVKISLKLGMKEETVHVYTLTFMETNKQSEDTFLNGQLLTLSPEGELPIISPKIVRRPNKVGIIIPARSVFFFIIPDAKSRVCSSTPTLSHEGQDLSKKLIQVAAEVLDRSVNPMSLNMDNDEPGKMYVKFGKNLNYRPNRLQKEQPPGSHIIDPTANDDVKKVDQTTLMPPIAPVDNTSDYTSTTEVPPEAVPMDIDKARRKRSANNVNSVLDMEDSSKNPDYLSKKELVNSLNKYAKDIYESGTEKSLSIVSIPPEILSALKKVQVTFTPMEVTPTPKESSEESTTNINAQSEIESNDDDDDENGNEEIVEKEVESENRNVQEESEMTSEVPENDLNPSLEKKVEKDDLFNENSLVEDDKKEIFRRSNNGELDGSNNDYSENESKREVFQESVPGPETESTFESTSSSSDQPKEAVSGDESLRKSKHPIEATTNGGPGTDKDTQETFLGSEDGVVIEPSQGGRPAEGEKSVPTVTYSIISASPSPPSGLASQDDEEATDEDNAKKQIDSSQMQYILQVPAEKVTVENIKEKKSDTSTSEKKTLIEMPGIIMVDGVEPKKVDELLINLAENSADDKDTSIDEFSKEKHSKMKISNSIKEDEVLLEQNPVVFENKQTELGLEKIPENNKKKEIHEIILKDEDSEKDDTENINNSVIKENSIQGLKDGPELPTPKDEDTIKIVRGISSEKGKDLQNNIEVEPTMFLLDPVVTSSDLSVSNKEESDKDEIKNDDMQPEDGSVSEDENNNSGETTEIKQLPVASFKNVPLSTSEDKSYNPAQKTSESEEEKEDNSEQDSANSAQNSGEIPLQAVVISVPSSMTSASSPEILVSSTESARGSLSDAKSMSEEANKNKKFEGEITKRMELLRAAAEKERREKYQVIINQIREAKEKFKAMLAGDDWKSNLQHREALRNLFNEEKELRKKFLARPLSSPETTLLSRPRRLTYYPEEESLEEIYDYQPEKKPNSPPLPFTNDFGKSYLNQDVFPSGLKQDHNHVIFPLDSKTPQAVVYNNKIIPAKLFGFINIDDSSRLDTPKPLIEPGTGSFFQKYLPKSYDSGNKFNPSPSSLSSITYDSPINTYKPLISSVPSFKSAESCSLPKDSYLRGLGGSSEFLPIVVLSPNSNVLRRKRSHPLLPYDQYLERKKFSLANNGHYLRKRSITSHDVSNHLSSDIPNSLIKELTSNDIKNENHKLIASQDLLKPSKASNYGFSERFGWEPVWSIDQGKQAEGRTFQLPPLLPLPPPPLPLLPPPQAVHRTLPVDPLPPSQPFPSNSLPFAQGHSFPGEPMSPETLAHRNFYSDPLPPETFSGFPDPFLPSPSPTSNEGKNDAGPSQAYFVTMLQDKFKSLMGMLETLAIWCGGNSSK